MTAQSRKRERRDIDPKESGGSGAERADHRRANDRGVGDGERRAFARQRLREPGARAFDHRGERFAAMRRGCRIAKPCGEPVRLALSDVLEASPRQRP